jgi:large subunit ribosomal protein L18
MSIRSGSIRVRGRCYRKARVRRKVCGTASRPRLSVYRSLRGMTAQIVDDGRGVTLVAVSSTSPKEIRARFAGMKGKVAVSKALGALLAERAKALGITRIVFDRGGNLFHGRVRAVAEGAREGGLLF